MNKLVKSMLKSACESDRYKGIEMLATVGDVSCCSILIELLETEQTAFIRRKVIKELSRFRQQEAVKQVIELLYSQETSVRNAALEIVQNMGEVTLPYLEKLTGEASRDLRKLAVDALAVIPGEQATAMLVEKLEDSDMNVVSTSAEALGKRGNQSVTNNLTAVMEKTPNVWVAFATIEGLANLGARSALQKIYEVVNNGKWNKQEQFTLGEVFAHVLKSLGGTEWLTTVWEMHEQGRISRTKMAEILYCWWQQGNDTSDYIYRLQLEENIILTGTSEETAAAILVYAAKKPEQMHGVLNQVMDKYGSYSYLPDEVKAVLQKIILPEKTVVSLLENSQQEMLELVVILLEGSEAILSTDLLNKLAARADLPLLRKLVGIAWRWGLAAESFFVAMADHSDQEIVQRAITGLEKINVFNHQVLLSALQNNSSKVRRQAAKLLTAAPIRKIWLELRKLGEECPDYAWPEVLQVMLFHQASFTGDMFMKALAVENSAVRAGVARISRHIEEEKLLRAVATTLANDPVDYVRQSIITSLANAEGELVYSLLTYMFYNEQNTENIYYLLNCAEIYRHQEIFAWLEKAYLSSDKLLKVAAIAGYARLGEKGKFYLKSLLADPGTETDVAEVISHELEKWGQAL